MHNFFLHKNILIFRRFFNSANRCSKVIMYEESHFVNNDVGVVLLQYFSPNASNFYGHSYYRYKKSYGDKAKG